MGEHSIDVIKMGIEYFLIIIFLACFMRFIDVRNSIADSLNKSYQVEVNTNQRLEFSKYDTGLEQNSLSQCVRADSVIEAIRLYRYGDVIVYVDRLKDGSEFLSDGTTYSALSDELKVNTLMTKFNMATDRYHPYLVYDNKPIRGPYTNVGNEVTGIAFIKRD